MYNGVPVLDVHGHVHGPAEMDAHLPRMMALNVPTPRQLLPGKTPPPGLTVDDFREAGAHQVHYMDQLQIDVQLLSPRPYMMMGFMEPHLLPDWIGHENDTVQMQIQAYPDRFVGAMALPQISDAPDLSHCLPELERCVKEYGFIGVFVSPDPAGRQSTPGMHEPYWYPLYEKCQELNLPILVHGTNNLDPRHRIIPLGYFIEQFWASQFLAHSDVFDRYPELKVVICHSGAAVHRLLPEDFHLPQRDTRNNLFYESAAYELNFLTTAIKQHGVSQTLFGTEAPGAGRQINKETGRAGDDLVPAIASFEFLSEDDKIDIFNRNVARLFPKLAELGAKRPGAKAAPPRGATS